MANVSSSNGLEKRPKLRFPGFDEPWKVFKAEELFQNVTDKNHPDETVLTIIQGKGTLPREQAGRNIHYDDASLSNYKKVEQGDFIIHLRSFEGGLEMANEAGIVSPAYTILRCKRPHSSLFYDAYFHTDEFINHNLSKSVEGIRDGRQISYEAFKWLGIPYCEPTEQEQISSLFSVLNERIAKQRNLVESLKKYKRGVSDYLFLQNSKMPIHCKWKQFSFGDVVEINPKTPPLPEQFIYIDLECVESGQLKSLNYINKNHAPSRAQRVLCRNDVLFQMVRPYQKNNYLYRDIFDVPVVASTGYAQIRCSECNPFFVYEQISSEQFSREAMMRSTGTGYPAINTDGLAQIPFYVPTPEEQEKIGVFLSALGAKIAKESEILAALDIIKKALMQQLFT